jgi:hypothetical protein
MRKHLLLTASILLPCGFAACGIDDTPDPDVAGTPEERRPHPRKDAGTDPAPDAPTTPTEGNTVTCYASYDPAATCSLPVHCCFSNYSAAHNGECTTSSCAWGTIDCDGPEDCASGASCCSQALVGADGIEGYRMACQADACGPIPDSYELCHTSATCDGGRSCVTAYGNAPEFPRTINICK